MVSYTKNYREKEAAAISETMENFWTEYEQAKDCPDLRYELTLKMAAICRLNALFCYSDARGAGCGTELAIVEYVSRVIGVPPRSDAFTLARSLTPIVLRRASNSPALAV